jgi:pimeloyl-ACP methyl ester carboxylesterase
MRLTSMLAPAVIAALLAAATVRAAEPQRRSVLVTEGPVTIETYVQGQGPAIVMLPSTGRDGGEDFDAVAARLAAAGFTVLRPQPRGIAGSTGPMEGVSLHGLGDDVALVIRRLGGGRAVIVGHAFGHFVARMTAVDHPAEVRGIVLAAAAAATYAPEIAATPRIAGDLTRPEAERLAALRLGFFAPGHDPHPWLEGWYPATLRMQADSREKQGVKQSDWWGAGSAPLLELIPASDPFKPRDRWEELRESYGSRVTTVVIPDASHALFPEQPEAVADAILAWVRTLPP